MQDEAKNTQMAGDMPTLVEAPASENQFDGKEGSVDPEPPCAAVTPEAQLAQIAELMIISMNEKRTDDVNTILEIIRKSLLEQVDGIMQNIELKVYELYEINNVKMKTSMDMLWERLNTIHQLRSDIDGFKSELVSFYNDITNPQNS